jgi:hypothetical protein
MDWRFRIENDMRQILILDPDSLHAARLIGCLKNRRLDIDLVETTSEAVSRLRVGAMPYDLVIVNVSRSSEPWLEILDKLQEASYSGVHLGSRPSFLCVSDRKCELDFELAIERKGSRYVYES